MLLNKCRLCRILFEASEVKKSAYLILAVFLLQLSGLGVMCAPRTASHHACCPGPEEPSPVNPSSLPDCCLVSLLNCQGSIAEAVSPSNNSHAVPAMASTPAVGLRPVLARSPYARRPLSHSTSPPLSPLLQTCLLLI